MDTDTNPTAARQSSIEHESTWKHPDLSSLQSHEALPQSARFADESPGHEILLQPCANQPRQSSDAAIEREASPTASQWPIVGFSRRHARRTNDEQCSHFVPSHEITDDHLLQARCSQSLQPTDVDTHLAVLLRVSHLLVRFSPDDAQRSSNNRVPCHIRSDQCIRWLRSIPGPFDDLVELCHRTVRAEQDRAHPDDVHGSTSWLARFDEGSRGHRVQRSNVDRQLETTGCSGTHPDQKVHRSQSTAKRRIG